MKKTAKTKQITNSKTKQITNSKKVPIVKIAMLFLLCIIAFPFAASLGIAPADHEVIFQPGAEQEIRLIIINNEQINRTVKITVEADESIVDLIAPEQDIVVFKGEREKQIKVSVKFPENMGPGEHLARVLVTEKPDKKDVLTAFLAVVSKIKIIVPPVPLEKYTQEKSIPEKPINIDFGPGDEKIQVKASTNLIIITLTVILAVLIFYFGTRKEN